MNVLIVDTSAWISYFGGAENSEIDLALKEGRLWLPPVVAAELMSAPLKSNERKQLRDFLSDLPLCDCDLAHWLRVGELRAELQKARIKVSTPDAHIAQCTLDLTGYLMSRDKIFSKIAQASALKLLEN